MAKAKEFLDRIVEAVAEESEIPCEIILSRCGRADVVDARWTAVYLMYKTGVYTMRIAEYMGITPRYVQYIITDFTDRKACNSSLRNIYEKIAKKFGIKCEVSAK